MSHNPLSVSKNVFYLKFDLISTTRAGDCIDLRHSRPEKNIKIMPNAKP
jgi:hypothetical protein